jgi:hypothetical protein
MWQDVTLNAILQQDTQTSSIPTIIATDSSNVWQTPEAVCTVPAPDDGWRFHPKQGERYWNKEIEKSDILFVVYKEYIWRRTDLWISVFLIFFFRF